jgi:uncharacterized membrane protein (DUF2068 family)
MPPHPPPVFIAMVLLALLSLTNLVPAQSVILEGNPTAAVLLPLVAGVGGLVGAWGLWRLKRWAMWLVIICMLNILMNAPLLTSPFMAIYAALYLVICALVIVLVVLPSSRRAYT